MYCSFPGGIGRGRLIELQPVQAGSQRNLADPSPGNSRSRHLRFRTTTGTIVLGLLTQEEISSRMHQKSELWLKYFKSTDTERNFPVVVENTQLFVNKYMLAGCSPVFKNALFGDLKEANQNHLDLPQKKLNDIVTLLSCAMYFLPGQKRCRISVDNFAIVYRLADEYIIEELLERCVEFLEQEMAFDVMRDEEIVKWFEKEAFAAIFFFDRLAKFRSDVIDYLKEASLELWKPFLDVIPIEDCFDIMIAREKRFQVFCGDCKRFIHQT